jgi:5'-deoxynucleotidase YfbR-like HD superfamily hydrolase
MNKTTMQTFTGKLIDLMEFSAEDVRLPDIAHALSILNRFTGHSLAPYSVAQHSVFVSRLLPDEHALWGLLHDASEAYLGDVATPLKHALTEYRAMEERVQRAIAQHFRLVWPMPPEVKQADLIALATEKRDLVSCDHDWGLGVSPCAETVNPLSWFHAKREFEARYKELVRI